MNNLLPLAVAVPLLAAAGVSALNPLFRRRRRLLDAVAIAVACAATGMTLAIMVGSAGGQRVYWFAGFKPGHGVAIGIDFAVGGLNGGLAALSALLVTAAMVFSWRYFEEVSTYFQALMLVFLAGMIGFCLTGDLFNMFVWFEVMGVSAYALTAYRPEEKGPIQGALNFAITNSVGAYLSLTGIALVYGRTGALNMAQVGRELSRHPPDGLVVVAFVLIILGLLIKGSIVPFHFWLADAHAVAPTPVCVLFSGVMVELGLYGVARVYWSVFGDPIGHRDTIRNTLLALGVLTAIVGALFCYRQRHLKRLLAFSTISHAGLFLLGIALLTPLGLAGAAVYVVGHGLVKAALFLCVGIVLHRLGSIDETWLHGRGRALRATGVLFTLAALGLADLPPFGTFLGKGWIEESGYAHGMAWLTVVLLVSSMLVGGAVLRVAGGVFWGIGDPPPQDPRIAEESAEETSETSDGRQRTPLSMIVPPAVLVALAVAVGVLPHLGPLVQAEAIRFQDQSAYTATVLSGAHVPHPTALAAPEDTGITLTDVATGAGTTAGAIVLALVGLYWRRLPLLRRGSEPGSRLLAPVQRFQSGVVNDYVTWIVVGTACLGGALAFSIR
ncbi:MAG: NADH dehydrogenase [Acidimicrobiaceae bacterium]|nr:NADH dehydrogenase [Acidimicrobiaceae bacterium]